MRGASLRLARSFGTLFLAGLGVCPALAQDVAPQAPVAAVGGPVTVTAILVVDQDRLYGLSAWGKRVEAEIADASTQLSTENRSIEAALTEEEKSLTERRAGLDPTAFRKEADAFDAKVVAIRAAQEAKARDITQRRDGERQAFYKAALPFFAEVMRDRGAVVILDKRSVFLSANAIDITDALVERVNTDLGAGPLTAGDKPGPAAIPPEQPAPAVPPPELPQGPTEPDTTPTPGGN